MTNRKPGDCVVNAELLPANIGAFAADCVIAGANLRPINMQSDFTGWRKSPNEVVSTDGMANFGRNVTDHYKEPAMTETLDLPTVLEECAEHIRAGRDPRDYFEINATENGPYDTDGFIRPGHIGNLFGDGFSVRRKRTTITINGVEVPKPERVSSGYTANEFVVGLHYSQGISAEEEQAVVRALRGES